MVQAGHLVLPDPRASTTTTGRRRTRRPAQRDRKRVAVHGPSLQKALKAGVKIAFGTDVGGFSWTRADRAGVPAHGGVRHVADGTRSGPRRRGAAEMLGMTGPDRGHRARRLRGHRRGGRRSPRRRRGLEGRRLRHEGRQGVPQRPAVGEALGRSHHRRGGGTVLRLKLTLANRAEGGATGTLVSVDQGGVEIPITTVTQTASRLELALPTIGGSFSGDLKEGRLTGDWKQGAGALPLVFHPPQRALSPDRGLKLDRLARSSRPRRSPS